MAVSLSDLRSDLSVARRIAMLRLRGQMHYRSSFIMQIVGNFVVNFAEVLVLWVLFHQYPNMGGWTLMEVVFLHGLAMVMFSLGDTVSNGLQSVPDLIREGTFDRVMLRPMSTYIQGLVNEVSIRHFGLLVQGLLLLTIGTISVDTTWSATRVACLVVAILSGTALFTAIFTIEAVISFWTVNSIEAVNALTYGGSDLGQYPLHIFQKPMRILFLWIVPIGFVTYYPALFILGKEDPLGFPTWIGFLGWIPATGFCVVMGCAWQFALRHYRSAGG